MPYRFLLLVSVLLLPSCAYMQKKTIQEVRIETPGAQDARCDVYVEGLRHRYNPPESMTLFKSDQDLVIECWAPGNRYKEMTVAPRIATATLLNGFNAFTGVAWDSLSGAMYYYPDVIEVSFVGMDVQPSDLPAHNNPDIRQPETYDLEEYYASRPRLNADKYKTEQEIRRREIPQAAFSAFSAPIEQPLVEDLQPADTVDEVIQNLREGIAIEESELGISGSTASEEVTVVAPPAALADPGPTDDVPMPIPMPEPIQNAL